jgi:hypothetical protein
MSTVVAAFFLLPSVASGWSWSSWKLELLRITQQLPPSPVSRRTMIVTTSAAFTTISLSDDGVRLARAVDVSTSVYRRQLDQSTKQAAAAPISYRIELPSSMKESSKPVKTHLDEVNFSSETLRGYQYGITVDPVRISSLKEVCDIGVVLLSTDRSLVAFLMGSGIVRGGESTSLTPALFLSV